MDGNRFDTFARALGRRTGRRGALGSMAAGAALLGGAVATRQEAAAGKKKDKSCKPGQTKCGKKCVYLQTNAKNCRWF